MTLFLFIDEGGNKGSFFFILFSTMFLAGLKSWLASQPFIWEESAGFCFRSSRRRDDSFYLLLYSYNSNSVQFLAFRTHARSVFIMLLCFPSLCYWYNIRIIPSSKALNSMMGAEEWQNFVSTSCSFLNRLSSWIGRVLKFSSYSCPSKGVIKLVAGAETHNQIPPNLLSRSWFPRQGFGPGK